MLKLAYKNFTENKIRTLSVIITIFLACIILFICFSYRHIVENQFLNARKIEGENTDISIEYSSSATSRIINTADLDPLTDKTDFIIGVLDLYASSVINGKTEYINLRGIKEENFYLLNNLEIEKSVDRNLKSDEIIIDTYTSSALKLDIDSQVKLTVGNTTKTFYVAKIVRQHPIFTTNGAYVIYCMENYASQFIGGYFGNVYNKIFIKVAQGVSIDNLIAEIKLIPQFENYKVDKANDLELIDINVNSTSLPMIIALAACAILALYLVYIIVNASFRRKTLFISRLSSIGATKNYIFGVFTLESLLYTFCGICLGIGANLLLINNNFFNLAQIDSKDTFYTIMLFVSALATGILFFISMLLPIFKTRKISVRSQNIKGKNSLRKENKIFLPLFLIASLISIALILPLYLDYVRGIFALVLCFLSIFLMLPSIALVLSDLLKRKINKSASFVAVNNFGRERLSANNLRIIFAGIVICTILASSAQVITVLKNSIINDLDIDIVLKNVPSENDLKLNELKSKEFLYSVHAVNIKNATAWLGEQEISLTILSSEPPELESIGKITYITDKDILLSGMENGIALNYSYHKINKLNIGDEIELTVDGVTKLVKITAFFNSYQYGGKIAITGNDFLSETFSLQKYDTIVCKTTLDIDTSVNILRANYSNSNIIVVTKQSLYAVFEKILADTVRLSYFFSTIILAVCFISIFSNIINNREEKKVQIYQMYLLGFDKKGLVKIELLEYFLTGLVAMAATFLALPIINNALTNAFSLGGLYILEPISYLIAACIGGGFLLMLTLTALTSYFTVKKKKLIEIIKYD